jgi:RsiW-degrading membrane proteinase PrsW (M82 family)
MSFTWAGTNFGILLFSLGAGGWFAYFRMKERDAQNPFSPRLIALLGGAISVLAAFAGYQGIDALGLSVEWTDLQQGYPRAVGSALLIGLVEEGAKMLPVLALAWFGRNFKRPVDGLIFATCAGVGFASAESTAMLLAGQLSASDGLVRAIAAPLTHALFAAPWGLGLWHSLISRRRASLAAGLAVSVGAHGLYDLLLARSGSMHFGSAGVVLVLWIWLIVRTSPPLRESHREIAVLPTLRWALVHGPAVLVSRLSS